MAKLCVLLESHSGKSMLEAHGQPIMKAGTIYAFITQILQLVEPFKNVYAVLVCFLLQMY